MVLFIERRQLPLILDKRLLQAYQKKSIRSLIPYHSAHFACIYSKTKFIISSFYCVLKGFGVAARSTQDCRRANPTDIICFHQADTGEYIRSEDTLT